MTDLNIERVDDDYIVHYEAEHVGLTDVTEIIDVITDLYARYSSINEDFNVGHIEFNGRFKGKEVIK